MSTPILDRRALLRRLAAHSAGVALASVTYASNASAANATAAPFLPDKRAGILLAGCAQAGRVWVGDHRGQLFASHDAGQTWRRAAAAVPGGITSITVAARVGVAVGHRSTLMVSTDAGQTWQRKQLPAHESLSLLDAQVLPDGRMVVVGAFGACWISEDAGQHWLPVKAIDDDRHLNACAASSEAIVAVGERGMIVRSVVAGRNWHEIPTGLSGSLFAVVAVNERQFVAAGLGGAVLYSNDAGQQWQPLRSGSKASWFGATAYGGGSDRGVLLAGGGGAIASLVPDGAEGWRLRRLDRQGHGAWRTVLVSPNASLPLLAIGESGMVPLRRDFWLS